MATTACARAGVLSGRGWALENVVARICREAGGRVTTNVLVPNVDLVGPSVEDNRRLEVVADGLPLFGGAQLAIDTTVVSALHADGTARRRGNAGPTPSWLGCTEGRASWSSLWKLEVVGRTKPRIFCYGARAKARVDATTCGAVVEFTMGFILVMHCRSGGGFHDVGIAWRSRRRW